MLWLDPRNVVPDTWKVLGLLVGGAGTIVAAVAKVLDERQKSHGALTREGADSSSPPHRPNESAQEKRALYVSIIALCVAVFGFTVSFLGEMASQRAAAADAARQARTTQQLLKRLAATLTRLDTISVRLSMQLPLHASPASSFRGKLEATIKNLVEESAGPNTTLNGWKVLAGRSPPTVFSYEFRYEPDGGGCAVSNPVESFLQNSFPKIDFYKPPIDLQTLDIAGARPRKVDLSLVAPPFTARLVLSRVPGDEDLQPVALHFPRIMIPRETWAPSGSIRSLSELAGAQMIIQSNSDCVELWNEARLGTIELMINNELLEISPEKMTVIRTISRGPIYSYVFPQP